MIYAISDIHGCFDALEETLNLADLSGDNRIIFLGDYIDYGPKSGQTLRFLYDYQQEYGPEKVIVLKGNHEAMLLNWIDEYCKKLTPFMEAITYDPWLKSDSENGYNTFRTFVTQEQFEQLKGLNGRLSFARFNAEAVRMLMETNRRLVRWIRSMATYYETETQIFVHAGVDEKAGDFWKLDTADDIFLGKYPHSTGPFIKTIIAGHIGTGAIAQDQSYHDVYFDGTSHYYIDGTVYKDGKLLLLAYDESDRRYYQVEKDGWHEISHTALKHET